MQKFLARILTGEHAGRTGLACSYEDRQCLATGQTVRVIGIWLHGHGREWAEVPEADLERIDERSTEAA